MDQLFNIAPGYHRRKPQPLLCLRCVSNSNRQRTVTPPDIRLITPSAARLDKSYIGLGVAGVVCYCYLHNVSIGEAVVYDDGSQVQY